MSIKYFCICISSLVIISCGNSANKNNTLGLDFPKEAEKFVPALVFVRTGTFWMGCKDGRETRCYKDEQPAHQVMVSNFYIGRYEVTAEEYSMFLNEKGNQKEQGVKWYREESDGGHGYIYKDGETFKVDEQYKRRAMFDVTWHGAMAYCKWLSEITGKTFRLPTEAEWEYVARGGSLSKGFIYSGSNHLGDIAVYIKSIDKFKDSEGKPYKVGEKEPNELKVYDMLGNVAEWCYDYYDSLYYSQDFLAANPQGPDKGDVKVIRGGSFFRDSLEINISFRNSQSPNKAAVFYGFRILMENG